MIKLYIQVYLKYLKRYRKNYVKIYHTVQKRKNHQNVLSKSLITLLIIYTAYA